MCVGVSRENTAKDISTSRTSVCRSSMNLEKDHKAINNELSNLIWEWTVADSLVEVFGVESIPAFGAKQVHC